MVWGFGCLGFRIGLAWYLEEIRAPRLSVRGSPNALKKPEGAERAGGTKSQEVEETEQVERAGGAGFRI